MARFVALDPGDENVKRRKEINDREQLVAAVLRAARELSKRNNADTYLDDKIREVARMESSKPLTDSAILRSVEEYAAEERKLRERLDTVGERLLIHVARARDRGIAWAVIAEAAGVSRQGAHKRWAERLGDVDLEYDAPVEAYDTGAFDYDKALSLAAEVIKKQAGES